jgi:hypothetical protein
MPRQGSSSPHSPAQPNFSASGSAPMSPNSDFYRIERPHEGLDASLKPGRRQHNVTDVFSGQMPDFDQDHPSLIRQSQHSASTIHVRDVKHRASVPSVHRASHSRPSSITKRYPDIDENATLPFKSIRIKRSLPDSNFTSIAASHTARWREPLGAANPSANYVSDDVPKVKRQKLALSHLSDIQGAGGANSNLGGPFISPCIGIRLTDSRKWIHCRR